MTAVLERRLRLPPPAAQVFVTATPPIVEESLVKSRDRVKKHGEVFTPRHMVDQMLDLVSDELEEGPGFVDKTFLEPAAGDGNFLVAILRRKLRATEEQYPAEAWAVESLFALASIYGIELLEDNHQEARAKMLAEYLNFHRSHGVRCGRHTNLHRAAAFLVDTNVVRGNTLTGLDWQGQKIQFSWWNRDPDAPGMVQREPFTLASLREDSRGLAMDFTNYENYAVCPINQIHKEVRANV